VQQPPISIAGERPAQTSPWIMPAWTYDYANAAPEWDAAPRSLSVGDELVVGNSATNYVTVRVEEVVRLHTLTNRTGTAVVCASKFDNMSPSGAEFAVERVLGYMFYIDYKDPNDPALTSTKSSTFQNDIASSLNLHALTLGHTIKCDGVGYERRGNRIYWFVQVTINNHIDIENKFRELAVSAVANNLILKSVLGLKYVLAYNAPRYLPNNTNVVFDSVNFGKHFRARLWGVHAELRQSFQLSTRGHGSTIGSPARVSPSLPTGCRSHST
jgi:hypothetical protein